MRLILALCFLALLACKKKKQEPDPVPVDPVPVCQTGQIRLAGKYLYRKSNKDTIEIVWNKNICPTENANVYTVKKLGEAVQKFLNAGETFVIKDYTVSTSNETTYPNNAYCLKDGTVENPFYLNQETQLAIFLKGNILSKMPQSDMDYFKKIN